MIRRLLIAALLLGSTPVLAQGFDLAHSASEIQISSDDGLEWQSDPSRVIAHGNAKAVRGDVTLTADTLIAYYRTGNQPGQKTGPASPTGGSQIWRMEAEGNVKIVNPNDTATGVKAIYDLDKAILVMHGSPARLETPTELFEADDALEYWENDKMAVLRGNGIAIAKQKQNKIQGDVLTAHFKDRKSSTRPRQSTPGGGDLELTHADAFGHVILTTPDNKATGDRGDYNAETGIATLTGAVSLLRDANVMTGRYARVDINSGVSNLYGYQPNEEKQRVQAVISPSQHKQQDRPQP